MGMLYYFSFIFFILLVRLDFCRLSDVVDYFTAWKFECHYLNGTQQVHYLYRCFYDQEEFVYFDSYKGKFIAKTEFGKPSADHWNSDKKIIDYHKSVVDTGCIPSYNVIHSFTADRRVKPEVYVSLMPHEDSSTAQHLLLCNVFGFFPSEVEVKWYRNGQEEITQVQSSELFHNGDWTFQILVMLETEIQKGDKFTCEVHHKSLEAPYQVDWQPQISDSDKNKMATGIVGFVLGTVFLIAGIVFYMRGRKAQTLFRGPQTEHFIHT